MDWVLRLPRTDILKEEDPQIPELVVSRRRDGNTGFTDSILTCCTAERRPVSGEVNQWQPTLAGKGGARCAGVGRPRRHVQVAGSLGTRQLGGARPGQA
jgi:hypothetical protein